MNDQPAHLKLSGASWEKEFSKGALATCAGECLERLDSIDFDRGDRAEVVGLLARIQHDTDASVPVRQLDLLKQLAGKDSKGKTEVEGQTNPFAELVTKLAALDRIIEPGQSQQHQQPSNTRARAS